MSISEVREINLIKETVLNTAGYNAPVVSYSGKTLRDFSVEKKEWFIKWRESVGR